MISSTQSWRCPRLKNLKSAPTATMIEKSFTSRLSMPGSAVSGQLWKNFFIPSAEINSSSPSPSIYTAVMLLPQLSGSLKAKKLQSLSPFKSDR